MPKTGNLVSAGDFETALDDTWQLSTFGGSATMAVVSEDAETELKEVAAGTQSLRIAVTEANGDLDGITLTNSSFTKTARRNYLLRFWARSDDDRTDIVVSVGNGSERDEVRYRLRSFYHLYHLPFDFEFSGDELDITFHFKTASNYFVDGVEILDQDNGVIDVRETLHWNEGYADGWGWTAGDNDISVFLPDGRSMWFFNDSFYGYNHADDNVFDGNGARFLRNAMVIHEADNKLYSYYTGEQNNTSRYFESIDPSPNDRDNFYWLGEAIYNPVFNNIQVYLIDVYDTGNGGAAGSGRNYIAEFSYPDLTFQGIQRQAEHALNFEDFFIDGDYIYLFRNTNPQQWVYELYVARCAIDDLLGDKGTWEFYDGNDWVADRDLGQPVGEITSEGFIKLQPGNYAAVSHPPVSGKLAVSFAERPEGPWTQWQDFYSIPQEESYWSYMSNMHTQLPNGRYLVSYSTNTWSEGWATAWSDKLWYRQRFIQADLLGMSPYTKPQENIAWLKTVSASSEQTQHTAAMAVDGDPSTRWSSQYTHDESITVDLGSQHRVDGVKIEWEAAMGEDYVIEVSANGSDWTLAKTVLHNIDRTNWYTGLETYGRYVRIRGLKRATQWGYSMYEFKVYGEAVN